MADVVSIAADEVALAEAPRLGDGLALRTVISKSVDNGTMAKQNKVEVGGIPVVLVDLVVGHVARAMPDMGLW